MRSTIILHSDLLVDGQHLASQTPQALGAVMAGVFGGQAITWEKAYREICADWDSYWADLDLNADNSLEQWREGRWRIVRAHFR